MKNKSHIIQPEKLLVKLFLLLLVAYVVTYGFFRIDALRSVPLNVFTLTVLIPIFLIDGIKTALESLSKKKFHALSEDSSQISVIIPTYNGEKTIRQTLDNLVRRFEKQNIIVSSNGSTDATCQIATIYGVSVLEIENPVGKVEAINQALSKVITQYVVILDDDTLVGNAVIPTNLLAEGYSAVAFRVLPKKKNWLSFLQAHEYRKSMDVGRGFHNSSGTVQTVSGAIGLFNRNELIRQILLHSGEFSGEDLQRTLLVHLNKENKGVVFADSTVETLVPETPTQLFWQRVLGWYPGQIATLHIYWQLLFKRKIPFRLRFEAFYTLMLVTAIDPLRIITLPVVLLSPVFLAITYITYVLMDLVPYLAMGRKEPFWVVLLSPIYGLCNSISRATAIVVFFYRRLTYYLSQGEKFDDYKTASFARQSISAAFILSFIVLFLGGYTYFALIPGAPRPQFELTIPTNETKTLSLIKPVPDAPRMVEGISIPASSSAYQETIKSGTTYWKILSRAVTNYTEKNTISLSTREKNRAVYLLTTEYTNEPLRIGSTITVTDAQIEAAIASAISGN